ncbi:MAG: redoxin domain-containing protein [Lachnospiraceae bacterium]|nr:redoxin domain-containing protein [Lachnospiraceae bacterium]
MENKKMLLVIGGVLVVLLAGAGILYSRLGSSVNREILQTQAVAEGTAAGGQKASGEGQAEIGDSGETVAVDGQNGGPDSKGPDGENGGPGSSSPDGENGSPGSGSPDGENGGPGTSSPDGQASQASAPDFTVQDGEENPVKLSDMVGKPVVLNFWASWCPPCKMEMPDFQEAFTEYGDSVHFMMVNLTDGARETVDTAKKYVEDQGYTFPVYFDTGSEAAIVYGIMAVPATFFIDAEGKPVARASGAIDRETLEKGIEMVLPGDESPETEAGT